ncbi:MAG: hypothetical protein AABO57_02230 [Acidobacteriota bacterium]
MAVTLENLTGDDLPSLVLDEISGIATISNLGPGDSPCMKMPDDAWDEPRLLSCCSLCREPLKYNPFVVDNRENPFVIN